MHASPQPAALCHEKGTAVTVAISQYHRSNQSVTLRKQILNISVLTEFCCNELHNGRLKHHIHFGLLSPLADLQEINQVSSFRSLQADHHTVPGVWVNSYLHTQPQTASPPHDPAASHQPTPFPQHLMFAQHFIVHFWCITSVCGEEAASSVEAWAEGQGHSSVHTMFTTNQTAYTLGEKKINNPHLIALTLLTEIIRAPLKEKNK